MILKSFKKHFQIKFENIFQFWKEVGQTMLLYQYKSDHHKIN